MFRELRAIAIESAQRIQLAFKGVACLCKPATLDEDESPICVHDSVSSHSAYQTPQHSARSCTSARCLGEVASILLDYYLCNGTDALLVGAKILSEAYLRLVTVDDPINISPALSWMGAVLFASYEQDWDPSDLEKSIKCYQKAYSFSSVTSIHHCGIEVGLAWALWHRFQYYDVKEDCITAVKILESARDRAGTTHTEQARIVATLSQFRFHSSTQSLIPAALQDIKNALLSLTGVPKRGLSTSQHMTCLIAEAHLNQRLSAQALIQTYLDDGFRAARKVLRLCSEHAVIFRHDAASVLYNLHYCASQHGRNDKVVWETHMKSAVEVADEMRSESRPSSQITAPNMRYMNSLNLMGSALGVRSDQEGDLDGLEKALGLLKEAAHMCPPTHISKRRLLNNLAYCLSNYYRLSSRVSALEELVAFHDFGHDYLGQTPFLATNIAGATLRLARISDSTSTAMLLINQAVNLCQHRKLQQGFASSHPVERFSVDLCMMEALRLEARLGIHPLTMDPAHFIQLASEDLKLLETIPADYYTRTSLVSLKAELLRLQAIANSDIGSLYEAQRIVEEEEEYVSTTGGPVSFPLSGDLVATQADLLFTRSILEGNKQLLSEAWATQQRAIQIAQNDWHERFLTYLWWASQAVERGDLSSAATAYAYAILLVPDVIFLGEDVVGRIEALRQVNGLSASSVSVALSQGDTNAAVEFLEKTRCILWSQSLQADAPELLSLPETTRDHFISLVREMENASSLRWSVRRQKADELQKAASQIRMLPGFERFLLPPLLTDIESVLHRENGYAVIIVLSNTACDVLALGTPGGHSLLHLGSDCVDVDRLHELTSAFDAACATARNSQRAVMDSRKVLKSPVTSRFTLPDVVTTLLAELWRSLLHPIIKLLGISRAPNRHDRSRVWWCPIGATGSLPLHAAGIYDGPAQDSVSEYLISSYTPTLSALHRLLEDQARLHKSPQSVTSPAVLLVTQPDAVKLPLLPYTRKEAEIIRKLIPSECFADNPGSYGMTINAALNGASTAHLIHFASHGHQDQGNPLNSGFDLKDGRLTLGQLMRVRAPHAQLAYLSVCESAALDKKRPDESLNLVGAMIFAGFRSVIGTMWAMDDIDGPFMAERIYSRIFLDGVLDMTAVPHAVDDAVRELRESGAPASRWATYVHFGL